MNSEFKPLRTFLVGGAMGVANIIPGVSGGTIAVIFGIYEYLMQAIGNFLTDKSRRMEYIRFLAFLFGGALISIIGFARVLSWSFENYPLPTVYLFIGLIIGSIPVVLRSHNDMKVKPGRIFALIIGIVIVVVLALMQGQGAGEGEILKYEQIKLFHYFYYALCGVIAASAMIIPGVSGSFILILLGVYWTVLNALSGLSSTLLEQGLNPETISTLALLASLGAGVVFGILVISRIMSWALKKHPAVTFYAILGLIIGSLYQIYPGFSFDLQGLIAILTLIGGIIISLKFSESE